MTDPMTQARAAVVGRLADHCAAVRPQHTLRVAVDGVTAAGKTTFADHLAEALAAREVPVIRISMDGFHHPREIRHRQGRDSSFGYYWDAYDFSAFAGSVLHPLGPSGDGEYWTAVIDLATDEPVDRPPQRAPEGAVLIVDGSFLQRGDLFALWDEVIYLDVGLDIAMARGTHRDAVALGGLDAAERLYFARYHAACQIYLEEVDPLGQATSVVVHDDPDRPVLTRLGSTDRPVARPGG